MLFSHPADFTPVCTTELGRIAVHRHEFDKRNVRVIALSCDKLQAHSDWVNVSSLMMNIKLEKRLTESRRPYIGYSGFYASRIVKPYITSVVSSIKFARLW